MNKEDNCINYQHIPTGHHMRWVSVSGSIGRFSWTEAEHGYFVGGRGHVEGLGLVLVRGAGGPEIRG